MYNIKLQQIYKLLIFLPLFLLLAACNGFFEKDNTPPPSPLVSFTPEIKPYRLWSANAGSGVDDEYLKMAPAASDTAIFTTSLNGLVTAIAKSNGKRLWQTNTGLSLTTGPGVGDGIVIVASTRGDVMALSQQDGSILWKKVVPGEILASPTVSQGLVIVKAMDGYLRAFATSDGHQVWSTKQAEPNLILRGSSAPLIQGNYLIVGFANGNLAKFTLHDGQMIWMYPIAQAEGAFAIQRMIDIDANPIVYEQHIYAATYQGSIASLNWVSGQPAWKHKISSYTGMTADQQTIYISDAEGNLWAFNAMTGNVNWQQTQLAARVLTAPVNMQNYVVVGDAEGYLHWLSKKDGHFVAREKVGNLFTAPIVDDNVLYAFTNKGKLIAYTLDPSTSNPS